MAPARSGAASATEDYFRLAPGVVETPLTAQIKADPARHAAYAAKSAPDVYGAASQQPPGSTLNTQSAATRREDERCSPGSAETQPQDCPGGRSSASTTSAIGRWSGRWRPRPRPSAIDPTARPPPTDFTTTSTR
jgi:hypothetical protein